MDDTGAVIFFDIVYKKEIIGKILYSYDVCTFEKGIFLNAFNNHKDNLVSQYCKSPSEVSYATIRKNINKAIDYYLFGASISKISSIEYAIQKIGINQGCVSPVKVGDFPLIDYQHPEKKWKKYINPISLIQLVLSAISMVFV